MVLLKLGGRAGIDQGIELVAFRNANGLAVGHGRLSMAAPDGMHGRWANGVCSGVKRESRWGGDST